MHTSLLKEHGSFTLRLCSFNSFCLSFVTLPSGSIARFLWPAVNRIGVPLHCWQLLYCMIAETSGKICLISIIFLHILNLILTRVKEIFSANFRAALAYPQMKGDSKIVKSLDKWGQYFHRDRLYG